MTMPNVQSSLVPCLVDIMRLIGMESIVSCSVALKMSWPFFPSLTRLCYRVRNMCRMNHTIQADMGTTKLLHSSLFMTFMTLLRCLSIDGLFHAVQYWRKFYRKHLVLNTFGHPVVMMQQKCGMRPSSTRGNIHLMMGCSVVESPQIPHDQANVHVEMEEAGKEDVRFIIINF